MSSARVARSEPLGHRLQQQVADRVAEAVVDVLEAIQVEEEDGAVPVGAPGVRDGHRGPVLEEGAVGEPGELVVVGAVLELGAALHQAHQVGDDEQREGRREGDRRAGRTSARADRSRGWRARARRRSRRARSRWTGAGQRERTTVSAACVRAGMQGRGPEEPEGDDAGGGERPRVDRAHRSARPAAGSHRRRARGPTPSASSQAAGPGSGAEVQRLEGQAHDDEVEQDRARAA